MILLLWGESVPTNFTFHICRNENFISLKEKNVFHPKTNEIVWQFTEENSHDYRLSEIILLIKYSKSFQYVYSKDCLVIYSSTEDRGFNRKRKANIKLSLINGKTKLKYKLGKDSFVSEKRVEINEFEQKSIKNTGEINSALTAKNELKEKKILKNGREK